MKKESLSPSMFSLIYDFVVGRKIPTTFTSTYDEKATKTIDSSLSTTTTTNVPTLISPARPNVYTSPIAIISTTTSTNKDDECPSLSSSLSSSSSSNSGSFGEEIGLAASLSDMLLSSSSETNEDNTTSNNSESSRSSLCSTMVLSNSVFSEEHNWDEMQKEWDRAQEKQVPSLETVPRPGREVRANGAHLRMIAAELNMMRANKIVCPLRPRYHLPRRTDQFVAMKPSPLRYDVANAT
ncbi:hypothetical protein INT45_007937 [Circinella minor]|uniref:Uncharacterized protein n=1 Tax=Circinella minor TaxID=1195481 RepID=A0A8H7VMT0_9FUNG|nr:hypothetical protein INT45_007937 [Circinella minor]